VTRARRYVVVAVCCVAVVVGVVLLAAARGGDDRDPPEGVTLTHSFSGGSVLGLPGELDGLGGLRLQVAPGGPTFEIVSWRFAAVQPKVAIRYRLRPLDSGPGNRCPGGHIGFGNDAASARESGDRFPCNGFREPAAAKLEPDRGWELIAVLRGPERAGVTVRFADPIVTLRDGSGDLHEVRTAYEQNLCVIGGARCVRFLRRVGFTEAEARDAVRSVCAAPHGGPLFAPPAHRPPRAPGTERGRDDLGRACAVVG
jgi:hypothetical protein